MLDEKEKFIDSRAADEITYLIIDLNLMNTYQQKFEIRPIIILFCTSCNNFDHDNVDYPKSDSNG